MAPKAHAPRRTAPPFRDSGRPPEHAGGHARSGARVEGKRRISVTGPEMRYDTE